MSRSSVLPNVKIPFFLAFVLTVARPTPVNDTLVTLEAGGLVPAKSAKIMMESESLQISVHQVKVDYVFRNTSGKDIDAVVAFPLPELDGATVENSPIELPSKDPVNFVSFKVIVDGNPVSPKREIRAFKNGHDITGKLRSLGLPISVLEPGMKRAINKLSQAQRKQLQQDELIVIEENQRAGKREQLVWAWWQVRIQYYWTQHFPSSRTTRVSHSYLPIVGGGYFYDDGASIVSRYCGNAAALKRIKDVKARLPKKQDANIALFERNIRYILTTANNWSGPIRDFHLGINSDGPDDIVLTCMPSVKQVSPTHYELSVSNYRPDRELDLTILQANRRTVAIRPWRSEPGLAVDHYPLSESSKH